MSLLPHKDRFRVSTGHSKFFKTSSSNSTHENNFNDLDEQYCEEKMKGAIIWKLNIARYKKKEIRKSKIYELNVNMTCIGFIQLLESVELLITPNKLEIYHFILEMLNSLSIFSH